MPHLLHFGGLSRERKEKHSYKDSKWNSEAVLTASPFLSHSELEEILDGTNAL